MTCGMTDNDGTVLRSQPGINTLMEQIIDSLEIISAGAMRRAQSAIYTKEQQKFLAIFGPGSGTAKGLSVDVKGHHDRLEIEIHPEEPFRANSRLILSLSDPDAARAWVGIPEPEFCQGKRPPLNRSTETQAGLLFLSQRANLDCVHCVASKEEAYGARFVKTTDLFVDQVLSEEEQRGFILQATQTVCDLAELDKGYSRHWPYR